jgi:hypothetical protein
MTVVMIEEVVIVHFLILLLLSLVVVVVVLSFGSMGSFVFVLWKRDGQTKCEVIRTVLVRFTASRRKINTCKSFILLLQLTSV